MVDGVLLAGGGLDSTVLLVWLLKKKNVRPHLLHVDYGQKAADPEKSAVLHFAYKYNLPVTWMQCPLQKIATSAIMRGTDLALEHVNNRLEGRNVVLAALAGTFACTLNVQRVWIGYHHEPEERPFPDATEETVMAINELYGTAYGQVGLRLVAPFGHYTRLEIFKLGRHLDAEIEKKSWTCYEDQERECGRCTHCLQKKAMVEQCAVS